MCVCSHSARCAGTVVSSRAMWPNSDARRLDSCSLSDVSLCTQRDCILLQSLDSGFCCSITIRFESIITTEIIHIYLWLQPVTSPWELLCNWLLQQLPRSLLQSVACWWRLHHVLTAWRQWTEWFAWRTQTSSWLWMVLMMCSAVDRLWETSTTSLTTWSCRMSRYVQLVHVIFCCDYW